VHNAKHHQANPQAVPPQPRAAAGGSNSSCIYSNCPACGTTFQEPADAGYESYLLEVYYDRPDSFSSGPELKPEMYKPVIKKQQLMYVPPLEIKIPVVNPSTKVDLVPHILATGLGIGDSRNRYVFKCLLDSGGINPIINKKCILSSIHLELCDTVKFASTQGEFASVYKLKLPDFCLPKFSMTHCFQTIKAFIFSTPNCP
jgi:hypothetical protein